jgi:translocation and assembly module TamB
MRRIVRILVSVLLGLLILLVVGITFFLESQTFDRWARREMVKYLEGRFAMRAAIGHVDIRLFDTEVELRDLRIWSLREPDTPAIEIEHILVNFTITRLFGPAVSFDSLSLASPRFRLLEEDNRRLNFANIFDDPARRRPGGRPFSITGLAIHRLEISDGLIMYRDSPLEVETGQGGLSVSWQFAETPERRYLGEVGLSDLSIGVGDFRLTDSTGSVSFVLLDNELRIPEVDIQSREASVRASGSFSDLRARVFRFDTDVVVNLPLVTSPNLAEYFRQGTAHAVGVFISSGGKFEWRGRTESPLLQFLDFPLQRFQSEVVLTGESVQVQWLRANLHSGVVTARGTLDWHREDRSEFQVDASGVQIRPLLVRLGLEEVQVSGLGHFAGVVGWQGLEWREITGRGRAFYRGTFSGFERLSTQVSTPRAGSHADAEAVPFEGNSRVSFGNETVQMRDGLITLPESAVEYWGQITFQGVYDMNFVGDSARAGELVTMAGLMGLAPDQIIEEYQIDPRGGATFTARLVERQDQPHVAAQIQADEIYLGGQLLGDIQAGVQAHPGSLQLEDVQIAAPDFAASVNGTLRLTEASETLNSFDVQTSRVPIGRFLPLFVPDVPVSGLLSGEVNFRETRRGHYQGGGEVAVSDARVYGEAIPQAYSEIAFQGQEVLLSKLQVQAAGGTAGGQVLLDLRTREATVDINGTGLRLEAVEAVQSRVPVSGPLTISVKGRGNLADLNFDVAVSAPSLQIREHLLEDVQLQAELRGNQAEFNLRNVFRERSFEIVGTLALSEPYTVDAGVVLARVPIEPYLALTGLDLPNLRGVIDGTVQVRGPIREPENLIAEGEFSLLQLDVENYQVNNAQPLQASYRDGLLRIPHVTFRGPETELGVEGSLSLRDRQTVNLKADGTVNLILLTGFMAQGASAGQLELNTVISGPLSNPRVVGTAELLDGLLTHPDLPTSIFDAEGSFKFTANQISIDEFTAQTTYGLVNAAGGVFLEGLRPTRWQVNIAGSGLRVEYPENVLSIVDVDLDALRSERSQLLSGVVFIRSAEYSQDISIPELILAATSPEGEAVAGPDAGEATQLNITVEAYQSIRINNNLADITASGDFTVRGTLQRPVILGSLTIDEGELNFENHDFEVTRGTVTFNNPRRTRPVLNFEATTEILEHSITIGVRGPIEQLNMSLRSDPPLPTPTIVTLLAVSQTQEEIGIGGAGQREIGSLAVYGATTLLSKSLGETVEARASRLFGFQRFSIDPFFYPGTRDPGARVTLGKQLTDQLTITYQTDLGNLEQGQFVSLEYRLTNWLTAIGTREENGSLALDFRFRKRF